MKISRRSTAFAVVATLMLAACGGDDGGNTTTAGSDSSSKTTAASAAATGSTSAGGSTGAGGSTPSITAKPAADSGKAGDAFCAKGLKISDQLEAAFAGTGSAPADAKKSFETITAVFAELTKSAPGEIKADFATLSEAFAAYAKAFAKANYDFTKLATDTEALKALQSIQDPKFEQASANVEAWVQKNCPALAK